MAAPGPKWKGVTGMSVCMVARNRIYIVLCLLVAGFNATPAGAQMLRCASKHLTSSDRMEAFVHARRVLPPHGGRLSLDFSCWNVDFARAAFRTPTAIEADDVQWWWLIQCERAVRSWSCEPASRWRQVGTNIAVAGKTLEVTGSVPEGLSGSRGRALIGTATNLVLQPQMPMAGCNRGDDPGTWSNDHPKDSQSNAEEFVSVNLTDSGPVADMYVSGWLIRIRFDQNDQPVCWEESIVVT
jgi:hypothetical protein